MAVSENERKIDNLRKENEHWREQLHELQIQNSDQIGEAKKKGFGTDIQKLDDRINELTKQLEKVEEINKKVQLVNDQVQGWCSKVIQKID